MRQHQRLRVRLRLRLGLALRLKRSIALGLSIDRLGALLRLSLSVATWAPRRVGVLELRAEDLDAPKDTAFTRCLASTIVVEIAVNKLAKEGARYRRKSPPQPWRAERCRDSEHRV